MNKSIDETDKKIVNLLLFDADMTNRQLASRCSVALGTVNNRLKKLKKAGVIKRKTIIVDYEKLGYAVDVLIALKISKGSFFKVAKELSSHPNVFMFLDMTGGYDAELLARFRTKRELDLFIKDLQHRQNIESTSTRLILNIYREREIR